MSTSPKPSTSHHAHIRRIRVENAGYVSGLDIEFPPGAAVICGGPGVGKSTVLALLRFALMLPVPESKRGEFHALIAQNLGAGRVYVTIVTAGGVEYELSRGGGDEASRLESPKSAAGSVVVPSDLLPVQFAGHGEFELMATDGLARLELVERFVSSEMPQTRAEIAAVRRQLDDNGAEIVRLDRDLEALTLKCSTLPQERARLDELKKAAGGDPLDLDAANRREALRARERMMIDLADAEIAWLEGELAMLVTVAKRRLTQAIDAEAIAHGPNAALLVDVATRLQRTRDVLEAAATRTGEECREARVVIEQRSRAIAEVHAMQNDEYRALLSKHESNAGRALERIQLEKTVAELAKAKEELDARAQERAQLEGARNVLRTRHRALILARRALVKRGAQIIREGTNGLVEVSIEDESERTKFRALLGDLVKGKKFEGKLLDLVVERMGADELCEQILRGNTARIAEKIGSQAIAMRLCATIMESRRVYELETVEMKDVPVIKLRDNETYKESHTLSSGQRTIAFVSIILLDKRGPLIADQPEDNLANKYLAEHLSRAIRDSQDEMQFIFVTHNGNLPIIGQVQRVYELQADGTRGWVAAQGETAAVKEPMENNFEGGRDAFVVRKEFYGVDECFASSSAGTDGARFRRANHSFGRLQCMRARI